MQVKGKEIANSLSWGPCACFLSVKTPDESSGFCMLLLVSKCEDTLLSCSVISYRSFDQELMIDDGNWEGSVGE